MKKKYLLIAAVAALMLAACGEKKFHVEGNITQATDSLLYFEHLGLAGPEVIDSVRLGDDGAFAFAGAQQETPEFYRLRIADQIVPLSIDSTETVTVRAAWPTMASQYQVEGSDNCAKIRELVLRQQELQREARRIAGSQTLTIDEANDSILATINRYKDDIKRQYIFPEPARPYAYFALFQTLGNTLLFNPRTDRDDIKVFAAVATSWDQQWPGSERAANLHNIAIEGMKNVRIADADQARVIEADKVQSTGLIDIALTDNKGQLRRLTDLKGKVVLLDFHVFAMDESPARILLLRELYNKYHAQGLEIYQVSLDADEHFWKQQTAALPWISVREPQGVQSQTLTIYNVRGVPEYFLIDRNNNIVSRSQTIKDIDTEIRRLL